MREIEIIRNGVPKTYGLKYTLASSRNIKEKFGADFFQPSGDRTQILQSEDNLAFFILQGVIWNDKTITIEDIAESVELRNVGVVLDSCFSAFKADAPLDLDPTKASTTVATTSAVQ